MEPKANSVEIRQKPTVSSRFVILWCFYWTNTKSTFRKTTRYFIRFPTRTNSSWKWRFETAIWKKNRSCWSNNTETGTFFKTNESTDTVYKDYYTPLEETLRKPSISKKVPLQRIVPSEFWKPNPFKFCVVTDEQKTAYNLDAISFTQSLEDNSTSSLPFEKHCNDIHSILVTREHQDSFVVFSFKNLRIKFRW